MLMFVILCCTTLRKDAQQRSPFAILTNFSVRAQLAKVDARNGFPNSKLATLAWKISRENIDHSIAMTKHDNLVAGVEATIASKNHISFAVKSISSKEISSSH